MLPRHCSDLPIRHCGLESLWLQEITTPYDVVLLTFRSFPEVTLNVTTSIRRTDSDL